MNRKKKKHKWIPKKNVEWNSKWHPKETLNETLNETLKNP